MKRNRRIFGWIGGEVNMMDMLLQWLQDPGTPPAKRRWSSLDVGTEIYVSNHAEAEWTLSGFDILVPKE